MKSNYVKESITSALLELMTEKEFSKISITDIVERAGVSRVTYYRHFADKEEVLSCYFGLIKDQFRSKVIIKVDQKDWEGVIKEVFTVFKDRKDSIMALKKAKVEYLYLEYITAEAEKQFPQDKYFMDFLAGAYYNTCMRWLDNDCSDPVETVAKPFFNLLYLYQDNMLG